MDNLESGIYSITFFIALIGAFFVAQIFFAWEKVKRDLLQARIFLDKKFVLLNLVIVAVTGFFISFHNVLMIMLTSRRMPGDALLNISAPVALLFAIMCLTILAYAWKNVVVSAVSTD